MKKIKFNLQVNGKYCRNLEELINNFNINDIVEYFDNGILERWLSVQNLKDLEYKVLSIDKNTNIDNKVRELVLIFLGEKVDVDKIINNYYVEKEKRNEILLYKHQKKIDEEINKNLYMESNVYYQKGVSLLKDKNYKEALELIDKAIKIYDKESKYYSLRAIINDELDDFDKAKEDARKSIALDSNNIEAYSYLYKEVALIILGVGGKSNIKDIDSCATRLRIYIIDSHKVNDNMLKQKCSAAGIIKKGDCIQFIYGTTVSKIKYKFQIYMTDNLIDERILFI